MAFSRKHMASAGSVLGISALLLAGCGAAPEENSSSSGENSDYKGCMVSDFGGFDDKSFNQNTHDGLKAAEEELGMQVGEAESTSETDYGPNLNSMVQQGCNLTVTVGFGLADATKEAAAANPDSHFAIVDDNSIQADNVRPIVYDTAQAAFQAGYLAAAQTKTGKVATYGGQNFPTVTIFMDGFAQGVEYYNQQNNKDVKVLGWDTKSKSGTFTGDFEDQAKGKTNTQNFLSEGADIIMPVAGPVGGGTLEAVKEYNSSHSDKPASVVWVDSDGFETNPDYQDIILTSVQKLMKEAVLDTFKQDAAGNFTNEPYIGTLENGGVTLAPFHNFDDQVSEETKTALDDIKTKIISGEIKVETEGSPKA
ncbi:BMP family ABC transporter substrate-binding protein [Rothia terrae]|jgi:basic membrane protein A|uniref:BMP family ABC transporter substrate-binding protein n=1 Tax=Rothia terrae TaxID=396015 RepID=A0A7H2BCJ4_9MICC|nr:BMP family ABC transporter substrate-binding protein [Rothia terrae]NKZ34296.1 BMP family ABC transporter substrate-binding protein [Rothia terrae]QNV37390.1 BMP family ABC transporter substrate-binding protein [Rothia terrae]